MKNSIFPIMIIASILVIQTQAAENEVSEKFWLQESIDKCSNGDSVSCKFVSNYLRRFYKPLCEGQGYNSATTFGNFYKGGSGSVSSSLRPSFFNKEQENVCRTIATALSNENFVKNVLKI